MNYIALVILLATPAVERPYQPMVYDGQEIDIFADITEQDLQELAGE